MTLRWLLAFLHLLALGIGLGASFARGRALAGVRGVSELRSVFVADNFWGVSGLLFLVTGLWRAFGGVEKGTAYYLGNPLFHTKMGLFALILLLEVWPMVALMRWRGAARRGGVADLTRAPTFAQISYLQAALLLLMMLLATGIARGVGG